MKQILLVEDEAQLAEAIILNLKLEGYCPTWVRNGNIAVQTALNPHNTFELIILDVMIPEKDGLEVCLSIRKVDLETPILFLSARNSTTDKILGLKSGGNDYLGKPFHLEEFLLRVKNLAASKKEITNSPSFAFSGNTISFDSFSATTFSGESIAFSKREIAFLKLFIEHPNQVISREELADTTPEAVQLNFRVIDNAIVKFRKSFEIDLKQPTHFISVRGVGYLFKP
ncbi:MAG: two-component system alkaline phosphatase synthesis response regulator PhoP [Salibacteraceae bacterium]|jgi:two-component system alkaline phosphatase synthesis response regulator PhoP|tara:strand:- start:827 stop:1510 length:684 start_codon:yes stop_codon:yes gene_type:complete